MTTSPTKPEILVIDDELQIRRLLRIALESCGYAVREAETGRLGLTEIAGRKPDVVILDLGLPDLPGLDVLKHLREWSKVPVLILSVQGQEKDKVAALDAGADDYLTKPFGTGELQARLRVLLRRAQTAESSTLSFGAIEADFGRRVVTKHGVPLKLTVKEYGLFRLLATHCGKVLTHQQILRELWGPEAEEQTHYLRVHMAHLRQKLEDTPNQPKYLKTESGIGYRLVTGE